MQAYKTQKKHAKTRGIDFILTFEEWMRIWAESGRFDQRGAHSGGYVMCRKGDVGPYAVGNVYVDTAVHNITTGAINKPRKDVPLGVARKGPAYIVRRWLGGRIVFIGSFKTRDEAEEAYRNSISCAQPTSW